jgi:hypothetical protein
MMHNWAAQVQFGHKSVLFGQDFGGHGTTSLERKTVRALQGSSPC